MAGELVLTLHSVELVVETQLEDRDGNHQLKSDTNIHAIARVTSLRAGIYLLHHACHALSAFILLKDAHPDTRYRDACASWNIDRIAHDGHAEVLPVFLLIE